jgi:hypothetical protein
LSDSSLDIKFDPLFISFNPSLGGKLNLLGPPVCDFNLRLDPEKTGSSEKDKG